MDLTLRACFRTTRWIALLGLLATAAPVHADDPASLTPLVSEFPQVLFVIEGDDTMAENWYGAAGGPTRWEVVADAIIAAVNAAPPEMRFAVARARNGGNYEEIAPFDMPRAELINAVADIGNPSHGHQHLHDAYWRILHDYISNSDPNPALTGWQEMPFRLDCSSIDAIVIGIGKEGNDSHHPDNEIFDGDIFLVADPDDEKKNTLLDDIAFWAVNNDLNSTLAGSQTVRTHAIIVDPDNASDAIDVALFESTATVGAGIYTRAVHPGEVALGISHVMTELMRSRMAVSGAFTTSTGHRLFQGWNEIWGYVDDYRGVPLYRGHLEAFQLNLDPEHVTYDVGEVIDHVATTNGALWDAGQLLASRIANEGELNTTLPDNCGANDPDAFARSLYTNGDEMGDDDDSAGGSDYFLPRSLIPFDSDGIASYGLGPTLLDYQPFNAECAYEHDFNRDCIVDALDAQELVDFLRGVGEAHYGYGGTTGEWPLNHAFTYDAPFQDRSLGQFDDRGWKLGSMFLSEPVFADNLPPIVTDDPAFFGFLQAIAARPAVLYVVANDGFLHAFRAPRITDTDLDGFEDIAADSYGGWEIFGYIPRHLVDHNSLYHTQIHRALNQKVDGETVLHDGSVNMTYAWMDDVGNGIVACDGAEEDAIDPSGCEYHRILVVSMGMGSRYHYALDVSNPCDPKYLWEWIGDADEIDDDFHGWAKGMSTGTPVIADVLDSSANDFMPVVFWSSGIGDIDGHPVDASNDHRPAARWYMVDLLRPSNPALSQTGYQIDPTIESTGGYNFICNSGGTPDCAGKYYRDDSAAGLFGTPAAVDYDEDGTIDALYIGSRHGFVYKVLIDNGQLRKSWMEDVNCGDGECGTCVFHEPATAPGATGDLHNPDSDAVFYRPSVAYDGGGLVRVAWGAGWYGNLYEPYDRGHMFMMIDPEPWGCEEAVNDVGGSGCGVAADPMDLDLGEKLVGPVFTAAGITFFATYVVGDACDVGDARIWALKMDDCSGAFDAVTDFGPENLSVTGGKYVQVEGIPSRFSFSNGGVYVSITGTDGSITALGPIQPQAQTTSSDRIYYSNWRNVF